MALWIVGIILLAVAAVAAAAKFDRWPAIALSAATFLTAAYAWHGLAAHE
jgi:hypothetical protein